MTGTDTHLTTCNSLVTLTTLPHHHPALINRPSLSPGWGGEDQPGLIVLPVASHDHRGGPALQRGKRIPNHGPNWKRAFNTWAPGLNPRVIRGPPGEAASANGCPLFATLCNFLFPSYPWYRAERFVNALSKRSALRTRSRRRRSRAGASRRTTAVSPLPRSSPSWGWPCRRQPHSQRRSLRHNITP